MEVQEAARQQKRGKMQYAKFAERVLHPSEEFTPIPFWFFNDMPDEETIRRQLKDYVDKGVNGIVLHPRIGIPKEIPYLSDQYFAAVRFIVETAAQLNMKVILYDEGMYPSGSAHGMVVKQNPGFASKGIAIREKAGTGEVIARLPDGRFLVYDFTGGTIRGIHFGEDDGESGAPASADILNPDAVELFIHLTHDQYYEHLKEFFGNTVIAFFTDEPCALGRNATGYREWVPGMEKEIPEAGGQIEELIGLFEEKSDSENKTVQIYRKLIKRYLREIFYRRLSVWCENHGISLIGHPEVSDDVEEQLYFQIPGQDLIMRRVVPKTGGLLEFDSVQAKLAADIARHLGRRRNANECFGVCYRDQIPWYFTAEDMKWYIDWLGLRGVNLYIPHAFYYSVEGARSGERPPDVGPNNIWWKYYKRFSDYMKRMSSLMTDSVNGARVAVLCDNNRVPYREVASFYENQVEFNYLPVSLLEDCRLSGGNLCIRGYEYEAVYDPLGVADQKTGLECSAEEIFENPKWKSIETEGCFRSLRAVRLIKDGVKMLLLSNEGEKTISGKWRPDEEAAPVRIDLWRGSCERVSIDQDGWSELLLEPCETCLYLFDQGEMEMPFGRKGMYLGDWTERFVLIEKSGNRAVYETVYESFQVYGNEYFQVTGEEMTECFCNGEFIDVSFWNDHRFMIGSRLQKGKNVIRLTVTGNAANLFADAEIAFGLGIRG